MQPPLLVLATGPANATSPLVTDIISSMLQNPYVAASVAIQFILGLALGYFSVKVLKYILAFIGILILGAFLNVWSLGGSVEDVLRRYYQQFQQLEPVIKQLLSTLGILTVGPVSIGFILGLIIGALRR
ncbi:MAG: hypothetical protein ABWW69_06700 [Pyrodictiaceae archaeon]